MILVQILLKAIYIYIYLYISCDLSDHSRGHPKSSLFNSYCINRGIEEDAPWIGLLTLDMHFIMLGVKQGDIKYYFLVFGRTRSGIESRSPGPLVNMLTINTHNPESNQRPRINKFPG